MTLRIALIQTDIRDNDPTANRAAAEHAAHTADAGVLLFPEMFTTGFRTDMAPRESAAEAGEWFAALAARTGKALAGSIAVQSETGAVNRFFFARPDGSLNHYDKRHLFAPGGEAALFTPGRERVVVEYCGIRMLLATCYDLRFPVWLRSRGDYDAILCCASWPESRRGVWDTLLRARAIENQCYVAGVNRVGADPTARYDGGSALIDFKGRTLAAAPDGSEAAVVAEIDTAALTSFRERFPVWRDADGFELKTDMP